MDVTTLIAALTAAVPDARIEAGAAADQPTVYVAREHLPAVAQALRDRPEFAFALLADVIAVDLLPQEPRFEVVYHLVAPDRRARLRLKVRVPGADPHVASLRTIWPAANWLEREAWDLMGITFDGHGDLRRLLTPDDWEGHPLRKDYPVQIRMTPRTSEPLQVTEEQFRANVHQDRVARSRSDS
ncbi:MAG TPA: NADH-quinone oxidoreductase subunit C [Vicinamibacterales bacterium]|nr:NADH-quinone oxidoreductase subunit C [Vicinamibacterales bacterium]